MKANAPDLEVLSDQLIQIDLARDHIASHQGRRSIAQLQRMAESMKCFQRKKRHLSFVVFLEIKKTIAPDSAPGHALDFWHFNRRVVIRFVAVMAKEIVPRGNVKMTDFH